MSAHGPERILRLKSVLERTGLSRSTIYRKVQARTFPKALKISERCIGWPLFSRLPRLKRVLFTEPRDLSGLNLSPRNVGSTSSLALEVKLGHLSTPRGRVRGQVTE
jgi:prophage regulatory protein